MEFEVFNRKRDMESKPKIAPILSVNRNSGICKLNRAVMNLMALQPHDRIELLKKGRYWYLVKTENPEGYTLRPHTRERIEKKRHVVLTFCSKTTAGALFEPESRHDSQRFYIQQSDKEYNGHPVFELLKKPAA